MICATSEDSDQTAHSRSLIRVFADRMCLLQPPGCPKRDKREPLPYCEDVQADLNAYLLHKSCCRFSVGWLIYIQNFKIILHLSSYNTTYSVVISDVSE